MNLPVAGLVEVATAAELVAEVEEAMTEVAKVEEATTEVAKVLEALVLRMLFAMDGIKDPAALVVVEELDVATLELAEELDRTGAV